MPLWMRPSEEGREALTIWIRAAEQHDTRNDYCSGYTKRAGILEGILRFRSWLSDRVRVRDVAGDTTTDRIRHVVSRAVAAGQRARAFKHGNVNFVQAMILAAGLLICTYLGVICVEKLSDDTLRAAFAVFLFLIALRLFIK